MHASWPMRTYDLGSNLVHDTCFDSGEAARERFILSCASLFRDNNQDLLALLNSKLHSWNEAKYVAQEAYVRIFQLQDFGAIGHLRGLLFKTAMNLAVDRLRERARRARDLHLVSLHHARDAAPSSERVCIADQDWERLQEAVEALPPKCRQAFSLVEFDCQDVADVADQMGVKPNTIYQLLKRAYEHLAIKLADLAATPPPASK